MRQVLLTRATLRWTNFLPQPTHRFFRTLTSGSGSQSSVAPCNRHWKGASSPLRLPFASLMGKRPETSKFHLLGLHRRDLIGGKCSGLGSATAVYLLAAQCTSVNQRHGSAIRCRSRSSPPLFWYRQGLSRSCYVSIAGVNLPK